MRKEWIWRTATGIRSFGFLPREYTHLGFWREHRALHGDGVRMRWDIIRQDQHGCLPIARKIARHRENEVGIGFEHPGHNLVGRAHRNLGRLTVSSGPQVAQNAPAYLRSRISGRHPTAAPAQPREYDRARFKRLQMSGPPMQKRITMNLSAVLSGILVDVRRFELPTPCLQSRCSPS